MRQVICWLIFFAPAVHAAAHNALLPHPQSVRYGTGTTAINGLTIRFGSNPSAEDRFAAQQLSSRLSAIAQTLVPIQEVAAHRSCHRADPHGRCRGAAPRGRASRAGIARIVFTEDHAGRRRNPRGFLRRFVLRSSDPAPDGRGRGEPGGSPGRRDPGLADAGLSGFHDGLGARPVAPRIRDRTPDRSPGEVQGESVLLLFRSHYRAGRVFAG